MEVRYCPNCNLKRFVRCTAANSYQCGVCRHVWSIPANDATTDAQPSNAVQEANTPAAFPALLREATKDEITGDVDAKVFDKQTPTPEGLEVGRFFEWWIAFQNRI